ncbi:MAG: elongator complex protein 3 [Ruminococcus sp.]
MKRSNVSIFVPFAGCPNRCSFCDQNKITGTVNKTTPEDVRLAIETALSSGGIDSKSSEIAFFGGSFTAIEEEYMESLLKAAQKYLSQFKGIRISTRPDCIDEEKLEMLKSYGVTAIELGAQSMCDDVLLLNNRGHNSNCVREASKLINKYGFSLGLQMMTGLYGATESKDIFTAEEFIKLKPDTVRIYPTVVLKGTELCLLYERGLYKPSSVEASAELCSKLIPMFESAGISVIRVGLHASKEVEDSMVAGGYHPAFRELCESKIYLHLILDKLKEMEIESGDITISVPLKNISKVIGQKKSNLHRLCELGYNPKVQGAEYLKDCRIEIQEG